MRARRRDRCGHGLGRFRDAGQISRTARCWSTWASARVFDEEAGRYRVKGDVDKACYEKASAYTPNPGGVGPMTRAMLLANVVEMAERQL